MQWEEEENSCQADITPWVYQPYSRQVQYSCMVVIVPEYGRKQDEYEYYWPATDCQTYGQSCQASQAD